MAKASIAPRFTFAITLIEDGDTYEVTTIPVDLYRAGKAGFKLSDTVDVEVLYGIAWAASQRVNRAGDNFEAWFAGVDDVEYVSEDAETVDPTPAE